MTVKSLLSRIEKLEKALDNRSRPALIIVLVEEGETLEAALARHPQVADAQFAAALSVDWDAEASGTGGRGWHNAPPMGNA